MAYYSKIKGTKLIALLVLLLGVVSMVVLSGCGSSSQTRIISGRITAGGIGIKGVKVQLTGHTTQSKTTDKDGHYTFTVPEGIYTVTPSIDATVTPQLEVLEGFAFVPSDRKVFLFGLDATGFDFGATLEDRIAAADHTVFLKTDGTVLAWGSNSDGQLGNGTTTDSLTPVTVSGLSGIKAIAAGSTHTVALKTDGTVLAWGSNSDGQLGNGTTTNSLTPVTVSGLSGIKAIAAGSTHTIALKTDGTVWAWGNNTNGQLGDGTTIDSHTPVEVKSITNLTAIAAGSDFTVAVKDDGTVWAWGNNTNGQLGTGTTTQQKTPTQVSGLTDVMAIAAGSTHAIALKTDGTVSAWGNNSNGQLGIGSTDLKRTAPAQLISLSNVMAISAGAAHTIALKTDGTVWAWGSNSNGQLGDGSTIDRAKPVTVSAFPPGVGSIAIAAGTNHTVALTINDAVTAAVTVWAWGKNDKGQLGDKTSADKSTPQLVNLP